MDGLLLTPVTSGHARAVQRRPYPRKFPHAQTISFYMIVPVNVRVSLDHHVASNSAER